MAGSTLTASLVALVCTWGVSVFALFLWQAARGGLGRDGAGARPRGPWTAFAVACLVLYLHPLATDAGALRTGGHARLEDVANVALLCAVFLLPALLAHLFFRIEARHLPAPRAFGAAVLVLYAVATLLLALWIREGLFGVGWTAEPRLLPVPVATACASTLVLAVELLAARRDPAPALRRARRVYAWLALASAAASLLQLAPLPAPARLAVGLAALALPSLLLLSTAYLHARAPGLDRLAKHGIFSLAGLLALTGAQALLLPSVAAAPGRWVFPAAALPLLLAAPAVHRGLSAWIDRTWLGRPRSAAEAHRLVLSATGAARDEGELLRGAEALLGRLFAAAADAPRTVSIRLGPDAPPDPRARGGGFEAPLAASTGPLGTIHVEAPADERPFLSEDLELLASLGRLLGTALENLRLRGSREAQERRAHALTLLAGRAELQALRARIDPHFLFNALNAIAELIHLDPPRAEAAVERLAKVFRYTLRRSEQEWVRVEEEVDFVRSYLELERVRFGARLAVDVRISEPARDALVPAMVLSVLVENAVKHGIARRRGPARIEIDVAGEGDGRLRLAVRDSGPGFPAGSGPEGAGGHGLRNTLDRLRGHFGEAARLEARRDEERGLTVVELRLPRISTPPAEMG